MRTLHPEIGAFAYRWKRVGGIHRETYHRTTTSDPGAEWSVSPLKALIENDSNELRHRLLPEERPFPFPMFEELVLQGATDYFATQVSFEPDTGAYLAVELPTGGMMISWTADGPDGFSDADLDAIRRLLPALALALKSNGMEQMADDLLAAYLGADAARRVMSGSIQRGSVDAIEAVILYFDLSGFTKLSEALPGPEIIDLLNAYFGAVVPLIEARGGNVLKFMGDGMLAIFARETVPDTEAVAVDAICALRDMVHQISAERRAAGLAATGCTISAHAGEVLYGNIGAPTRLDFTVIGPAVNTAARINAMSANVDQPIVIGSNVARPLLDRRTDLVSLGQYRLRGVAERQELFTLD
jgi:adenylate cyclase